MNQVDAPVPSFPCLALPVGVSVPSGVRFRLSDVQPNNKNTQFSKSNVIKQISYSKLVEEL